MSNQVGVGKTVEQEKKCLRGEHEAADMRVIQLAGYNPAETTLARQRFERLEARICKHCRAIYVEKP